MPESGDSFNVALADTKDFEKANDFEREDAQDDRDIESGTPPQRSRLASAIETFSPNW